MTPDLLKDLPAAFARVDCTGERHAIRWEAGSLQALDHGDPEGERALAALGGTSCTCLDVLAAWSHQRENPAILTALSRGAHDPIRTQGLQPRPFPAPPPTPGLQNRVVNRATSGAAAGWVAVTGQNARMIGRAVTIGGAGPQTGAGPTFEEDVVLLAGLGHHVPLRLVATVTAALLERLDGPDGHSVRPVLEASLFGRATSALRAWLALPDLGVELEVTAPEVDPRVHWGGVGPVELALPPRWVLDVWGRDLTVMGGRFTLALLESAGSRTTLMTVDSDLGLPRPLAVELL
jgi:hypothetical protein